MSGLFKVKLSNLNISLSIVRLKIILIRSEIIRLSPTLALLVAYK